MRRRGSGRTAPVRTVVSDDRDRVVADVARTVAVPAGATVAVTQAATVHRSRLWDGVLDLEFVPRLGSAAVAAISVSPEETP